MTTKYPNQSVQYTDIAGNTATLTPDVGLVLSNGVTTLTMDQTGFTNGVQTLLFQDIYTTVEKTKAIKYLTSTPTTLSVVDKIEVVDTYPSPNYKSELTSTNLTITELSSANYSSLGYNGVTIVNTAGISNTITENDMVIINTITGELSVIDQHRLVFNSSTTNQIIISNDISVSEPYIRMDDSLGRSTIYSNVSTTADSGYCYTLNNGTRFMKQENPFSFKNYELVDGDYIEPYMPFVMIQNGSALKLRRVADYFDDDGYAGWSCIVSNYGGGDIQIDIADASSWYAFSNGGGLPNPINIKKYATCRITLVYSSIDSQYIWAVSQF